MPATCAPGAWPGPARWLGECIYGGRDAFGLAAGMASLACWCFAQFPQIVRNARTRSAAALSPAFLAEWLAGDTCNLIGCLLLTVEAAKAAKAGSGGGTGGVLKTQTATAAYFICVDCVLIFQYVIYGALAAAGGEGDGAGARRRRERAYLASGTSSASGRRRGLAGSALVVAGARTAAALPPPPATFLRRPHQAPEAFADAPPAPPAGHARPPMSPGEAIAWVSAAFYLGSRAAQLAKNAARRSVDGLAVSMFGTAIAANVLYGASVLARSRSGSDLKAAAPWLAGSLGTVVLDCAILAQAAWLRRYGVVGGVGSARRPSSGGEAGGGGGGGAAAVVAGEAPPGLLERRPLLSAPVEAGGGGGG